MSFFYFSKKAKHVSVVLDIGSGSVAGALISTEGSIPEILYSLRLSVAIPKKPDSERLLLSMISSCEEMISSLHKHLHTLNLKKVETVHCFLSSPWYANRIHTTRVERPEPVTVTEHFLADLLSREDGQVAMTLSQHQKEYITAGKIVPIEHKVLKTALNGYEVAMPYGKKARSVEVTSYISIMSEELKTGIENIVSKYMHAETHFSSFIFALQYVLKNFFPHEQNYLACDVAAETTDIGLVENGHIQHTWVVPQGRNMLVRKVSEAFDVGSELALSFVRMFNDKKMEQGISTRLGALIKEVEVEWKTSFDSFLSDNNLKGSFHKVFITADDAVGSIYKNFLVNSGLIKNENDVVVISAQTLRSVTNIKGGTEDPFVMIEAFNVHKGV